MIFVTVGSDWPFSRLVKAMDDWCHQHPEHPVFAQVGRLRPSDHVPVHMQWVDLMPATEFERRCAEAEIIVAHAGMGSIISALKVARPIVILPRTVRLDETRNDHQFATVERFKDRAGIFVANDEAELDKAVGQALAFAREGSFTRLSDYAPVDFTDRLRDFILFGAQNIDE